MIVTITPPGYPPKLDPPAVHLRAEVSYNEVDERVLLKAVSSPNGLTFEVELNAQDLYNIQQKMGLI